MFIIPGAVCLLILGVRGITAWAAGPAATAALFAGGAFIYGWIGIFWDLKSAIVLTQIAWCLCALVPLVRYCINANWKLAKGQQRYRAPSYRHHTSSKVPALNDVDLTPIPQGDLISIPQKPSRSGPALKLRNPLAADLIALVGALMGAAILGNVIAQEIGYPNRLFQSFWDAVFHQNSIQFIRDFGNASSFGGLAPMWARGSSPTAYYPAIWHSIVAIAPWTKTIPAATNSATLAVVGIWALGIAALARVTFPKHPEIAAIAPLLAAGFGLFPTRTLGFHQQLPYGTALALTPGALALLYVATRWRVKSRTIRVATQVAAIICLLGVIATNGAALGAVLVFGIPIVIGGLVIAFRRTWIRSDAAMLRMIFGSVFGTLVFGVLAYAVDQAGFLHGVLAWEAEKTRPFNESIIQALSGFAVVDFPEFVISGIPAASEWHLAPVLFFVVIGVIALLLRRQNWWLILTTVAVMVLFVLAAGPESQFRWLTGIWWTSPERIAPLAAIPLGILTAYGISTAVRLALTKALRLRDYFALLASAAIAATLLVVTNGMNLDVVRNDFALVYHDWNLVDPPLDESDVALLWRLSDVLSDQGLLLGEPGTGAAWAYAVSDIPVVFGHRDLRFITSQERFLVNYFNQIHEDSRVCDFVRDFGITYFWSEDTSGYPERESGPGLFDVDTTYGFEPIISSDRVTIYRITACD